VIRGVLLPATMALLGERNWYLPRWLSWLPRAGLEDQAAPEPAVAAGPAPPRRPHPGHGEPVTNPKPQPDPPRPANAVQ